VKPEHARRSGGSIIRKAIKQLEDRRTCGTIKKQREGSHRRRKTTARPIVNRDQERLGEKTSRAEEILGV